MSGEKLSKGDLHGTATLVLRNAHPVVHFPTPLIAEL
jgi:hypothetical protein